jgi:tetratricopeptide (TPR) repeat protein
MMMCAKRAFSFLALLGLVLAAPVARAESESKAKVAETLSKECVAPAAYAALQACPGGPKQYDIHKARGAAFKSAPPPVEKKDRKDDLKPQNPTEGSQTAFRDARTTRLKARARALLITEITGLERLYSSTRKKSPDRPQLVRRLAEGYVELEAAADRDKVQSEINADDAKKAKNKAKYDKSRGESAKAKKILDSARQNAIKFYNVMKKDYPNYSKIDEVLYYLAYEYEQAGDLDNARKVYFELIQTAPKSKYIPNAYLAFGELFFGEAMGDPTKWALSGEAYKQVLKYPPPENKVWGYAHYKLGYVYWNTGDYAKAIQEFKETIEFGEKYSDQPNAAQLQKAARKDLIPVYAVSGKPDKAYNFFKPLSGDKSGDEKTLDMLNDLGTSYLDTGHYEDAIVLYHELMSRDKGDRFCVYQTKISLAVQAMKASDKPAVIKEFDNQIRVRKQFLEEKHSDKSKAQCSNDTAELLAETGMSWHLEAVGTGGVRGTGSQDTMDKAAMLYRRVVDTFKTDEFAKFQFPRIVKEDWPSLYKIKYAMADLLYFQQKWELCGPAFDSVVDENPTGPEAPEAAYASVLCYQKMYDLVHKGSDAKKGIGLGPKGADTKDREAKKGEGDKYKPKPFTDMQKGMIQAFNRYVCYIKPSETDKEAQTQYVEVKYARARTYFEAQHWEEAAIAFRDVAINSHGTDAAGYAANLYLESLNVLGAHSDPPRPTCFEDMANDVPVFVELFCQGPKSGDNKEQCDLLARIQCDIRRLHAQKIVEVADGMADKGQDGALEKYKEGGDAYLDLWRTYGEAQLEKNEASQCGRMDEILYNGAQAYQAGRLLAKSINVRRILLDPKFKLNETEVAKKSIYQIGRNYQAIAVYDVAATYFERFAEATKYQGENADQAINDAVVLRLGLGESDQAIADSEKFNKYFGAKKPELTAQIAFAIADHYAAKEDWENARKRLQGQGLTLIDKNATADIQVMAHALLARVLIKLNQPMPAGREYAKVAGLWKDPQKAVAAIQGIPGEDEAGKTRRIGKALTAVGEALFYFAEQKKALVDKVIFPEYKGNFNAKKPSETATSEAWQKYAEGMKKEKEAIEKHINVKVSDWVKKKKSLLEEASGEYKKIVDLQPVPPPQWVIASGARVGSMWGGFVKDFRAAPIPSYMKSDDELRNAYYAALDGASEPQKLIARGAFKTCLDYSVTYQYFDQFSRSCEEWLAQNYKSEFHLIDEFRGAPTRVNSTLKERAYPLQISGEPYIIAAAKKAERPVKKDDKKDDKKDEKKK